MVRETTDDVAQPMFFITANFIGTFLEVLVYGAYVATFIRHVRVLVLRRRKLPPRTFVYLSTASFLLFVVATTSIVGDLIFATHIVKNPTEPIDFSGYGKSHSLNSGCTLMSLMISDAFLLYRSYILYNSRLRVVALPLLVFVVECGIGIWSVISLTQKLNDVDPWTDHTPGRLTLPENIFGFISASLNIMCTSLIIACMWRSNRRLLATGVSNLQLPKTYIQVGAIIVNSAAIYIVWLLSVFVTSTTSSTVCEVFAAPFVCVTALIFSTIIVSASRPPSLESEFQISTISFIPRAFSQDSMPSIDLSATDMLEAGVQPAESSSLDRSTIGVSPKETQQVFLLFVAATVSIVVDLIFATHIFKNPTEPIDFSGFGKQRIINSGCGMFAMVVSDAFLLYRSYILYNCRLRVVCPSFIYFRGRMRLLEGIGIQSVISLSGSQKNVDPWTDHPQILTRVETIFGSLSAGVNVMCTSNGLLLLRGTDDLLEELKGLIVACMWRSHRRLLATGAPNLQHLAPMLRLGYHH
ncbi:hypothetical protein BDP27DRAFT_1444657 [Rhodocollybia butyracea]|uniref:Uncharacterized protein n=1 Tax=Rhodocollybia butyracea TaxID=206335 RepID=A0A9P5Q425_9AGAR|nr:hypothetical protein BDP27DRAFT_1444657 [Rhodocollybia butyracea]